MSMKLMLLYTVTNHKKETLFDWVELLESESKPVVDVQNVELSITMYMSCPHNISSKKSRVYMDYVIISQN